MEKVDRRRETDLGETLEFMRLLWSLDHVLQRTSKWMDRSLGVTGPQRLVIRVVGYRPGISAGDVAQTLRIHPSTLTGILKRLEKRKIIRRVPDPRDGRRAFLHLGGLGETINTAPTGTVEEAVKRAIDRLPLPQISAARRAVEALVAELEAGLPADHAVGPKPQVANSRK
jgi:DNA-binding MarR family transcriptional regulator